MLRRHHSRGQWLAGLVLLVVVVGSSSDISFSSPKVFSPPKTDNGGNCKVFCNTKILRYVEGMQLFNDSKTFLEMKLIHPPQEVENNFDRLLNTTKNNPSRQQVRKFVEENFDSTARALEPWIPSDWNPKPKYVKDVYDLPLRNWIQEVNARWKILGRKASEDLKEHEDLYSQIYVPNPFIVPGGRFTELYYWDSYWIIEGLLLSEMHDTAKGMIENFLYLVKKFGYIPNGTRKYYLGRSQPPFLISMMNLYWQNTKDLKFLNQSVSLLEAEYFFWQKHRSVIITVDKKSYKVFHYNVISSNPRPESYSHDEELVKNLSQEERVRILSGLKSAAESGWDFSSRWTLTADGVRTKNLRDINTMAIAPVCLNSLMGLNARLLSEFYEILGNASKSNFYKTLAEEMNTTMSRVFWSERDGVWLDYNLIKEELIPGFYPSNLMPLWTETYGVERSPEFVIEQVIAYLDRNNISSYPGGIPTSCVESGEQWDLPNGWAPLQYMVVLGLHKASKYSPRAEALALSYARVWVLNVYYTFLNTTPHELLEKYEVTVVGSAGHGGEYVTQTGFGWTNDVIIKFLSQYGHKIRTRERYDPVPLVVGILLLVVPSTAVLCYMHRTKVFKRIRWDDLEEEESRPLG